MARLALTLLFAALLAPSPAAASDRRFAYTYETPVLAPGQFELEPHFLMSMGKAHYFFQLDHSLELEWGVAKRVQTAFYVHLRAAAEEVDGAIVKSTAFRGFSNEWKFSLLDPVADPIGLALYAEFGVQAHEFELEGKVLLDKALGPLLLALNVVGELEIKARPLAELPELEAKLGFLFGASVQANSHFAIGAELHEENVWSGGELEHAFLHAGPAVHVSTERVWFTASVLPQIVDLKSGTHDVDEGVWVEANLVFGVHL